MTSDGLGTVGMFTCVACLSVALACSVSCSSPCLFLLQRLRWLLLGQRMEFAWATVMDSPFFEYVVLASLGLPAS